MGILKSKKVKLVLSIIGILFVFGIGFFVGASYSTIFFLNYFRGNHALDIREQIGIAMVMHEGRTEDALEVLDRKILFGLHSFTTSDPRGFPEDVMKWDESVFICFQKAKEYYEKYPDSLDKEPKISPTIKALLAKVPESDRRTLEKDFAKRYTGKAAPALDVSEWIGQPVTLDKLQGKVVLLDFWGNWCIPCQKTLPHTQELYDKYKNEGLEVIGIHSLKDSEKAADFISRNKYSFRTGLDTDRTAKSYSVTGWPTYYLIDKQGRLAWGPEHSAPPEKLIESLLAE
jgi:thiol-disulfide isomerase/thioredoxin